MHLQPDPQLAIDGFRAELAAQAEAAGPFLAPVVGRHAEPLLDVGAAHGHVAAVVGDPQRDETGDDGGGRDAEHQPDQGLREGTHRAGGLGRRSRGVIGHDFGPCRRRGVGRALSGARRRRCFRDVHGRRARRGHVPMIAG